MQWSKEQIKWLFWILCYFLTWVSKSAFFLFKEFASHYEFCFSNKKVTHEKYYWVYKQRVMHGINFPKTRYQCSLLRDHSDRPDPACSLAELGTRLVSSCSVPLEAHHKISRISLFKDRSRQKTFPSFFSEE